MTIRDEQCATTSLVDLLPLPQARDPRSHGGTDAHRASIASPRPRAARTSTACCAQKHYRRNRSAIFQAGLHHLVDPQARQRPADPNHECDTGNALEDEIEQPQANCQTRPVWGHWAAGRQAEPVQSATDRSSRRKTQNGGQSANRQTSGHIRPCRTPASESRSTQYESRRPTRFRPPPNRTGPDSRWPWHM